MSRRGHVLILVLVVIAASAAACVVFYLRYSADQAMWRDDDRRVQALWLARSALDAGVQGQRTVDTDAGTATVRVRAGGGGPVAEVEIGGGRAVVTSRPWTERWDGGWVASGSP